MHRVPKNNVLIQINYSFTWSGFISGWLSSSDLYFSNVRLPTNTLLSTAYVRALLMICLFLSTPAKDVSTLCSLPYVSVGYKGILNVTCTMCYRQTVNNYWIKYWSFMKQRIERLKNYGCRLTHAHWSWNLKNINEIFIIEIFDFLSHYRQLSSCFTNWSKSRFYYHIIICNKSILD